jgi:nucleotide-binding universal stress UspA family protein
MIHNIIAPIDGSTHAQMALDLSADLAARYDAQLVLVHVAGGDGNLPEDLYSAAARELEEAEGESAQSDQPQQHRVVERVGHMLLRIAKEEAEAKGVTRCETVVDFGDPAERILHHAKERSADLIVMGSRGFGELKGLILGSVSHKVFHLAPCTCVTVHRQDEPSALSRIGSIVVPSDGSEQANKAVDLASEIAGKYGARLVLLYVMSRGPSLEQLRSSVDFDQLSESARAELDPSRHPMAEHLGSAFIPPVVSRRTQKEIGEHVLAHGQRVAEAKGVQTPKLVLKDGDPARVIVNIAKREQADMITMGSRGLGGVEGLLSGSVSYKVSHTARCSCMIVR